ncbi:hypothetical protein [Candidatus Poriferisodalis sp.]|uniref:hypothetical protein n=1 Tax=Candidatus Poriferisodalis sp. TaxID=3101277 RepID=UPI003B52AEFD
MDPAEYVQIASIVLGVLAIVWHQQRSLDKVRTEVAQLGQRLARIEGFLGVGVSAEASQRTPGAAAPQADA